MQMSQISQNNYNNQTQPAHKILAKYFEEPIMKQVAFHFSFIKSPLPDNEYWCKIIRSS
jgi:hypothetical protein